MQRVKNYTYKFNRGDKVKQIGCYYIKAYPDYTKCSECNQVCARKFIVSVVVAFCDHDNIPCYRMEDGITCDEALLVGFGAKFTEHKKRLLCG